MENLNTELELKKLELELAKEKTKQIAIEQHNAKMNLDQDQSYETGKIVAAVIEAKKHFDTITKSNKVNFVASSGQRVKYNFAGLTAILIAIEKHLLENGVLINEDVSGTDDGSKCATFLRHVSGQYIKNTCYLKLPPKELTNCQKMGGGMSFARRYSIVGLLSLPQQDDDGNEINNNNANIKYSNSNYNKKSDTASIKYKDTKAQQDYLLELCERNGKADKYEKIRAQVNGLVRTEILEVIKGE